MGDFKTNNLPKLEWKLRNELDVILQLEELLWFQHSHEDYIVLGDRNTNFYHASTIMSDRV